MNRPVLGVIGGMGVWATAHFYEMITHMQTVSAEQEYLDILLYSKPSIPDRTAFITGKCDESPLPALLQAARTLKGAGVACIAVPCITCHAFYEELASAVDIPVLNMLKETALYAAGCGCSKVGLLATEGTLQSGLFRKQLESQGVEVVVPSTHGQDNLMAMIYDIKCGREFNPAALDVITEELFEKGAKNIILGCTELSLAVKHRKHGYIDALAVLAWAALERFDVI